MPNITPNLGLIGPTPNAGESIKDVAAQISQNADILDEVANSSIDTYIPELSFSETTPTLPTMTTSGNYLIVMNKLVIFNVNLAITDGQITGASGLYLISLPAPVATDYDDNMCFGQGALISPASNFNLGLTAIYYDSEKFKMHSTVSGGTSAGDEYFGRPFDTARIPTLIAPATLLMSGFYLTGE